MLKHIRRITLLVCLVVVAGLARVAMGNPEISNEKEIIALIRNYIGGRLAVSPLEIEVHLLGEFGDFRKGVPLPDYLTVREANATSLLGNARFLLVSDEPGQKVPPFWIDARSEWIHPAVVAVRPLRKHQILSAEDLAVQNIRSDQPGDYFSKTDDLVGKRVIQQERTGTVMTREMIENPPLFHQGERVTILVETGHIRIIAPGKALEDGYQGKPVSVLNLDSQRTIYGEPLDAGTVKVKPGRD